MDYKKLYEKNYDEEKLVNASQGKIWGLRKLLKKYYRDRHVVVWVLVESGEKF